MEEADALCSRVGIMVKGELRLVDITDHVSLYLYSSNFFFHLLQTSVLRYEILRILHAYLVMDTKFKTFKNQIILALPSLCYF